MAPALRRPLRIGTDCSGMETPILALKALGVPYDHRFSCDCDKNVEQHIFANFDMKNVEWYPDLLKRNNDEAPEVDLYVAGFPCQPFSAAGKQKGMQDKRAKVFWGCAQYVENKLPRVFLMENVSKIQSVKKRKAFKKIWHRLTTLADSGYLVEKCILKTQEHGVPQSRARMYFVGLRKDIVPKGHKAFPWPEPLDEISLEPFLDPRKRRPREEELPNKSNTTAFKNVKNCLLRLKKQGEDPLLKTYVIDCDSSVGFRSHMKDKAPCITRSRGSGHWVTSRGRRMTVEEMLRLQGMDTNIEKVLSDRQLGQLIGNAMSQNVVERILCRLLPLAGLVPKDMKLKDRWVTKVKNAPRPEVAPRPKKKTSLRLKSMKRSTKSK